MNHDLVAVGVAAAILAVGCGGSSPPEDQRVRSPAPKPKEQRAQVPAATQKFTIRVTRDDGSLPRGCGPRATARRVIAFLDAFNRGDTVALDRRIADERQFQWFSAGVRGLRDASIDATGASGVTNLADAPPASERPQLLSWLTKRHRAGERMRLVDIEVSHIRPQKWVPVDFDLAGVQYVLERKARDIDQLRGANRLASGKGGISCVDGAVLVWAMGLDPRRPPPRNLCPRPAPLGEPRVTACTLHSAPSQSRRKRR